MGGICNIIAQGSFEHHEGRIWGVCNGLQKYHSTAYLRAARQAFMVGIEQNIGGIQMAPSKGYLSAIDIDLDGKG